MDFLQQFQPISKAIAATLAGALVSWLAKKGIVLDSEALALVLGGLIAGGITYFAPKNKASK